MIKQATGPTLPDVQRALGLSGFDVRAAWKRMLPSTRSEGLLDGESGQPRPAGVLLLLYMHDDMLTFPLTRRTELVATHKGQISLPGGAQEGNETSRRTALRETCEELHVCLDETYLIGSLTPLHVTTSYFMIHPHVAYIPRRPAFEPDPIEVAEVLEVPLPLLLDERIKALEHWTYNGIEMDVPFYRIHGQTVWGATAIILSEFETRLRTLFD
ncbi:MAG: CoA pyrophosphatase [Anaerolineae bacterium]|nr:CoA pyrophosphatase [Anaerolineae bacterium]